MTLKGFLRSANDGNTVGLRLEMPQWCAGCQKYVSENDPHEDGCPINMEIHAQKTRALARGELSFKGYLLLYGIFLCLLGIGYLMWKVFGQ